MALYALTDVEEAFDVTREFLTPIDVRRWLKLAFVVFFVGSGVSLPTAEFGTSAPSGTPPTGEFPAEVPPDAVALVVAVVVAGLLFAAVVALIGAVMEFVLVESLRTGEVSIRRHWRRRWRQGVRLFGFRIAIGLPTVALFVGWVGLLVVPLLAGREAAAPSAAFLIGVPVVVVVAVVYSLVSGLTTVFVVPIMIREEVGVLAAWRRLWGSIRTAWRQYLAYVAVAFLLTVGASVVASFLVGLVALAFLVPAVVAVGVASVAVPLASPAGVAVLVALAILFGLSVLVCWLIVQVPIVAYLRYHALLVLGDIEPSFALLPDRGHSPETP